MIKEALKRHKDREKEQAKRLNDIYFMVGTIIGFSLAAAFFILCSIYLT